MCIYGNFLLPFLYFIGFWLSLLSNQFAFVFAALNTITDRHSTICTIFIASPDKCERGSRPVNSSGVNEFHLLNCCKALNHERAGVLPTQVRQICWNESEINGKHSSSITYFRASNFDILEEEL